MFEFMLECHLLMLLTAVFFFSPIAGWQPYYQKGTVRWRATSGQLIAWELQKKNTEKSCWI